MNTQLSLFGKTSMGHCPAPRGKISARSSRNSPPLREKPYLSLDLRENGQPQERSWETITRLPGEYWRRNTGECPNAVVASTLSPTLAVNVPAKYYLSEIACRGILAQAEKWGKPLPPLLEEVLRWQADNYDQLMDWLTRSECGEDVRVAERARSYRKNEQGHYPAGMTSTL